MKEYIDGDLVRYTSLYKEPIAEICEVRETSYLIRFMNGNFAKVTSKEIKPIPITTDILEKNGWKTQNGSYYYLNVAKGFISYVGIDFKHKSDKGQLYVEIDGNNIAEIQYCHELNHLFFGMGIKNEMEV